MCLVEQKKTLQATLGSSNCSHRQRCLKFDMQAFTNLGTEDPVCEDQTQSLST